MRYCLELKSLVSRPFAGYSLTDFLTARFTYRDLEFWLGKIAGGQVLVNSLQPSPDLVLKVGDEVQFSVPDFYEPDLDTSYHKIWENENLILVSKPADLPVHSTRRIYYQTMTAILRRAEQLPEINPLHRLDRETSGLMFYLKKPFSLPELRRNPEVVIGRKYYLAVVTGEFPYEEMQVDVPLKQANCPPVNYKMLVAADGQSASTVFYRLGVADGFSLVLARLVSGRKHQIRAHLEHLGFPITGDKLYAHNALYFLKRCDSELHEDDLVALGASHHLLHAWSLGLKLPGEDYRIFFSDYFSKEFADYLQLFPSWKTRAEEIVRADRNVDTGNNND